jgi:hypothetical protein
MSDTRSDTELVSRFLHGFREAKRGGQPLQAVLCRVFAVGSTSAREICRRHGFDPDVLVRQRRI